MRALVADDDADIGAEVGGALRRAGHVVDVVGTGEDALWLAEEVDFDLMVIDIQMPRTDGLTVCRTLRERGSAVPILLLTGRGAVSDRIAGLDAGADDYLPKPFELDELLARVRAITRRPQTAPRAVLEAGDLSIDLAGRTVTKAGERLVLTAKEVSVLEVLLRHAGEVVPRDRILSAAWDFAYEAGSNVVDAYIRLLRRKLDAADDESRIETFRGVGYRLLPRP